MALLEDEEAVQLRADSPDFWVMVAALRRFVLAQSAQAAAAASSGGGGETMAEDGAGAAAAASASLSGSSASLSEGFLPLEGSIPDMTATTELYLQLQRLYREQAEAHVEAVQNHVRSLLAGLGRAPDSIPGEAVRHVCKHARALRVVRYKALAAEAAGSEGCNSAALQQALACEATQANASFYVLLRASDRFHATHRRLPGLLDSQLEGDVLQLKAAANALLAECGVSGAAISDDYVVEMCRAGGAELHVVAALVGGMAAQEAIKLVTEQFVPVPGVLMYNGITCSTAVLEL